jgi:hypothetical protein
MAAIAERNRRRLEPAEYAVTVQRARAVICEHVPPGATVAVVSRGDEQLLALEGRRGWHFPRAATGAYAGHHPADSTAAVTHLEELRTGGARYLAVPASARWWLDHYEGLARHLREHGETLADDPDCALFALGTAPAGAAGPDLPLDPATRERLGRFLDALLPERCRVLVAGDGWDELALAPRAVARVPGRADGGAQEALAELEDARHAGGAAYLVVPLAGGPPAWAGALLAALEAERPPLARRERLAAVFDLQSPIANSGAATP